MQQEAQQTLRVAQQPHGQSCARLLIWFACGFGSSGKLGANMENGGVTAVSPRSFNEAQKLAHFRLDGWMQGTQFLTN